MTHRCFKHAAIQVVRIVSASASVCALAAFITAGIVHAAEPSATSAPAVTARSYAVQRGDTLDRVIQKTMADSPLKIELLRKAFVETNPQAFVSGNVSRLKAGSVLQLPDHTMLLRSTILPVLEAAEAASVTGAGRSSSASDRRSWVRFP